MNSTPNPALDKIIESSYDRANNKFIVNTSDTTSSVLIAGDDYSGDDPAVHNPVYVDANGFIATNTVTATHQDIVYGYDEMASILTIGNIAPWSKVNPVSSDENGWYNSFSGLSSLYWYNNGPLASQQTFNYQTEIAFNKLNLWFMIIKQYRPLTGSAGSPIMPTIRVYSKPTGTNDIVAGICHSYWDYNMTAGQAINYGESIVIYSGQVNKIKLNNPEVRRIVYTNTGGGGDRGNNEIINHIEFSYNTGFTYNTLVIEAGIFVNQVGLINYYFSNGNSSKAEIATIAMKAATDTINTNIGTINTTTGSINTKLTGMTYASNRLQTQATLVDADGDIATISTPASSAASTIRGLDTQSYLNAYNILTDLYNNLTSTLSSPATPSTSYAALDIYARNPATTVDKSLFGLNNTGTYSGINMYPIQPKVKQLVMSGTTATANGILGGHNSTQTISNVDWGITKPKTFYISMASGGVQRTFYYDYVDTNGNERTMGYTIPTPITNWYALPLQTGYTEQMVGINNVRVTASLTSADTYYISNTQSTANTVCSGTYGRTFNAVITIPNNAIGYVTNVSMFNAVASNYDIWKYDNQAGARKMIYYYNTAFATNHMSAGADGSLGGYLQAGEAVLGGNENANSMTVFANVVIKYLS